MKVLSQDGREILYREKDMEEIPEGEGTFVIEIRESWDGRDKGGSIVPDGIYPYTLTVKYKGDKESVSGNVKIDIVSPDIKITSPPNGSTFYTSPILVSGNTDDPNATIKVNGKEIPNQNGSFSVSLNLVEGENQISAVAEDECGNMGRDSITVSYIPDKNPPVINIIEPRDGSEISTTKPRIEISYTDDLSGLELQSLKILINGGDWTTNFTISENGAFWQVDQDGLLNEGENIIQASIKDKVGNEGYSSSHFIVKTGPPQTDKSAFIHGKVYDAKTGSPLQGVTITVKGLQGNVFTDSEGKFIFPTPSGGNFILTAKKEGWTFAQRRVSVQSKRDVIVEDIYLTPLDSKITNIGPSGGTATNSDGTVTLIFPEGALENSINVSITRFEKERDLPGNLNIGDNIQYPISYVFCADLRPDGVVFKKPVLLRVQNKWGFAPGERIPMAYWDREQAKWIPEGVASISSDGAFIEANINHFSPRDINTPVWNLVGPPSGPNTEEDDDDDDCDASAVGIRSGRLKMDIPIKFGRGTGKDETIELIYNSQTAYPSRILDMVYTSSLNTYEGVTIWPEFYELNIEIEGVRKNIVFSPLPEGQSMSYYSWLWDGKNARNQTLPTGRYTAKVKKTHWFRNLNFGEPEIPQPAPVPSGASATSALGGDEGYNIQNQENSNGWGGVPVKKMQGISSDLVPFSDERELKLTLINNSESPFGAGWWINGLKRIYIQDDGEILLVNGDGSHEIFEPKTNFASLSLGAKIDYVSSRGWTEGIYLDPRDTIGGMFNYHSQFGVFYPFHFDSDSAQTIIVDLGSEREIYEVGAEFQQYWDFRKVWDFVRISSSLDKQSWDIWGEFGQKGLDRLDGKIPSPLFFKSSSPKRARYIKYEFGTSPTENPAPPGSYIFRLYAFGYSEYYRRLKSGFDEGFPKLKKLDNGFLLEEKDGRKTKFNLEGYPLEEEDRNGNKIIYQWDGEKLISIQYPSGHRVDFSYGSNGKIQKIQDSTGRRWLFDVDSSGNLRGVTYPDGSSIEYSYDERHLLTSKKISNSETKYEYNEYGRISKVIFPDGSFKIYYPGRLTNLINPLEGTYESPAPQEEKYLRVSKILDQRGNEWKTVDRIYYSSYHWQNILSNAPYEKEDPAGGKTLIERHPHDPNLISRVLYPSGKDLRFRYDSKGNLIATERKNDGALTEFTYNELNQIVSIKDPMGKIWKYSYDERGNLIKIEDPTARASSFEYDTRGLLTAIIDGSGARTEFSYDEKGNLKESKDPLGNKTTFIRNERGDIIRIVDPNGNSINYEYDIMGRLISMIDARGARTTFTYSGCQSGCSGELLTSITDPRGNRTTFEYDSRGRLIKETDPSGKSKLYSYDEAGNLISFKNRRGQEIRYEYDSANRLIRKILPDGDIVNYTYNSMNQLTSVEDRDSLLKFRYDSVDRLIEAKTEDAPQTPEIEPSRILKYFYHISDRIKEVQEYKGNLFLSRFYYYFDDAGRVTGIDGTGDIAQRFSYDSAGRLSFQGIGDYTSKLDTTFSYDEASRLTKVETYLINYYTTLKQRNSYQYDNAGNIVRIDGLEQSSTFTYDSSYQLISANHTGKVNLTENYTYDLSGNRLSSHRSSFYTYDNCNRLTEDQQYLYSYDEDGNLIRKLNKLTGEIEEFLWDAENRLIEYRHYPSDMSSPDRIAKYGYDGLGRRHMKEVNGIRQYILWNGDDEYEIMDSSGNCIERYQQGMMIDGIAGRQIGQSSLSDRYIKDHLGSVQRVIRENGTEENEYIYDSFGNIIYQSGTLSNQRLYTSRYYDSESGLYYYRARYYDPDTGRFISEDPIGFWGGGNLYLYVINNPVRWRDPYGLVINGYLSPYPGYIRPQCGDPCIICNGKELLKCILQITSPAKLKCIPCARVIADVAKAGRDLRSMLLRAFLTPECYECGVAMLSSIGKCIDDNCQKGKLDANLNCKTF